MDFKSPPAVIRALESRVAHGVFGYGSVPAGLEELVCEMLDRNYCWQVEPEHLVWLPSLVSGLNVACRAIGTPSDGVLTLLPIYPPFLTAPANAGRELVTVPLAWRQNRWLIDFAALEEAITPRTRLLLFCNPHNPVGRVYGSEELEMLVSVCARHDIIICSDEIHCDLILDRGKKHVPTAALDPEAEARTITLMASSKTFNIPGLGCSFAVISNRRLRHKFLQAMAGIVPGVNILGFTATEAAYRQGWHWLASLLDYLRENSLLVERKINDMAGLSMGHVEATYLAWIDARKLDAIAPGRCFEAFGVGLSEGGDFGFPGFVRLNFGCRRALLQEALQRMKRAVCSCPG